MIEILRATLYPPDMKYGLKHYPAENAPSSRTILYVVLSLSIIAIILIGTTVLRKMYAHSEPPALPQPAQTGGHTQK